MKDLKKELKQILLGLNYGMVSDKYLITITIAYFLSDFDLSLIMEACHKRNCIVFIYPKDENHFELSISSRA